MNIDQEIEHAEKRLQDLRAKRDKRNQLTPMQRLAEAIHEVTCRWNHVDGCSWMYEKWDDNTIPKDSVRDRYLARSGYLRRAENLMRALGDPDTDATKAAHLLEVLATIKD